MTKQNLKPDSQGLSLLSPPNYTEGTEAHRVPGKNFGDTRYLRCVSVENLYLLYTRDGSQSLVEINRESIKKLHQGFSGSPPDGRTRIQETIDSQRQKMNF